jgi:AcrR family transcriptional regulator
MANEFSGRGDPARSLALLWGTAKKPTRGPKQQLDVRRIAEVAVAIADAEGLAALSMRRVADELGVGTMSLYTYVPGKAELLDLMLDATYAELAGAADADGWRARLAGRARADWAMYRGHPWILGVARVRGVLGPNEMDAYEAALGAVVGLGLSGREMDASVALLAAYVRGAALAAHEAAEAERATGQTDEAWWAEREPLLRQLFDPARFPIAVEVQRGGGFDDRTGDGGYHWKRALDDFEFGLARVLDGIEALVRARAGGSAGP